MNRLTKASGLVASALTAVTASVLLLVPGHARLTYPRNGAAPSAALATAGPDAGAAGARTGRPGAGAAQGATVHGLDGGASGPRPAHHRHRVRPLQPDLPPANSRVALLRIWLSDWLPPAQPPRPNCSADTCTTTGGGWDGPKFQINGDHFNFGPVLLQIRGTGGTIRWSATVSATSYPGFPGGALYARTSIGDCSGVPGTSNNDYAIAYDTTSGRWSNEIPLDSECASF